MSAASYWRAHDAYAVAASRAALLSEAWEERRRRQDEDEGDEEDFVARLWARVGKEGDCHVASCCCF